MKYIFVLLLLAFQRNLVAQVANITAPSDTLRGVALILTDAPDPDQVPTLTLAKVYAVPGPVRGSTNVQRLLYFWPDGEPIPDTDILVFKKRPWRK